MTATQPVIIKTNPWPYVIGIGVVIIILLLTLRYCNNPAPSVDTKKADSSWVNIDSLNLRHEIAMQRLRDSLEGKDLQLAGVQDDIDMYVDRVRGDAASIRLLNGIITRLTSTTPKEIACDSLVAVNTRYMGTVDSLLRANDEKDSIQLSQLQLAIDAAEDCDRAYEAVTSNLLQVRETYDKLKAANKPRLKVYVGLSGTYNALVYGAGPSIAVQGKKGGVISASYQITNGRPLYQAGYLVPIRVRR